MQRAAIELRNDERSEGGALERIIDNLVREFEQGKLSRRQLIWTLAVAVTAAAGVEPKLASAADYMAFKAIAVNHISYQVADYAKTPDFYPDPLGMEAHGDDGKQCYMRFCESVLIPRNRPPNTPRIDHIPYTTETWDKDAVEAELKRRGLQPRPDTENSFHVRDLNGYELQICGEGMRLQKLFGAVDILRMPCVGKGFFDYACRPGNPECGISGENRGAGPLRPE